MKPLEYLEPAEILALMDEADERALAAVKGARDAIAAAARSAARAIKGGGRLIYTGAGSSGRLGVLDASECPPTFSANPGQVIGIIAGGKKALTEAVEGAEDDLKAGKRAIARLKVTEKDIVVGITASGTTPYVLAALEEAGRRGAETWMITCNPISHPAHVIFLPTGPEVVRGSSRLAAGTATKLALNRITTAAFIMLGKVYGELMVDVMPTNRKLVQRAAGIISEITGCGPEEAEKYLKKSGMRPKVACLMIARGTSKKEAERLLEKNEGFLRRALKER